jgi:hypothetical protein
MMITEKRLEKALCTLAETDSEYAERRGAMLRYEYMADCAESVAYAAITDGSVEDRKRAAKVSEPVQKAKEEYFKAVVEYERLKAFRQRENIVIELYRTMEASRRTGNIT